MALINPLFQHFQVRDERERCERLEEQLNDMTELHQNEVQNIKSGVRDMEEKVLALFYERTFREFSARSEQQLTLV